MPHSWGLDELIAGHVDAISAYRTDQPTRMRLRGVEPALISAREYGIDFYGDLLVTREALARERPDVVAAFVAATLRGWHEAMANPEALAVRILGFEGVTERGITLELLREEARAMRELVVPDLVDIGHVNVGRLDRMAQTLVDVGLFDGEYSLDGFVFDPTPAADGRWRRRLALAGAAGVLAVGLALVWVAQLRRQVRARTAALEVEIAQRRETDAQLRASEERLRLAVQHMPVMLCAFDEARRTVFWNAACERVTGYTAAEALSARDLTTLMLPDPVERQRWLAEWRARDPDFDGWEFEIVVHDGSRRAVLLSQLTSQIPVPGWAYWGIALDVTEIRRAREEQARLERQLQQGQKLESLGVLAGGIAHDFNNLLTGILGHADLALAEIAPSSPAHDDVAQVVKAARRAADLTRELLAYSGRGRFVIEPIDLSALVRDMAQLLGVSIPKRCRLALELSATPWVEGDATQVRQVVMNLILNAVEAIGERDGVITMASGAEDLGPRSVARFGLHDDLPDGRYAYLRVTDTGQGMTDAVRERIFDPFFTTKFTGRGLGLAAALGIVRGHQGALRVTSTPGQGSAFTLLLPVAAHVPAVAPPVLVANGGWRGRGLVLVVDDEEPVRRLATRMLERLGFETCVAANGREAVDLFAERSAQIDLVLLDMTMPVMGGEQALVELRRLRPDVRVVMSSGFSEQEVAGRTSFDRLTGFVQKPYRARDLQVVIERALQPAGGDEPLAACEAG